MYAWWYGLGRYWLAFHGAVDEDKCFTRNELADMFPKLLGHIREE